MMIWSGSAAQGTAVSGPLDGCAAAVNGSFIRRAELPDEDVRRRIDEAFRRTAVEVARRAARVAVLSSSDLLASALAGIAALAVAAPGALAPLDPARLVDRAWPMVLVALFIQPLALQAFGAFGSGKNWVSLRRVARGVALATFLGWLRMLFRGGTIAGVAPGTVLLLYAPAATLTVFAGRVLVHRAVQWLYRRGVGQRRVLFVGGPEQMSAFLVQFPTRTQPDLRIVGRISPDRIARSPGAVSVREIERALRETRAEGVIIDSALAPDAFEALVHNCFDLGATVCVVPRTIHGIGRTRLELRQTDAGSLMQLAPEGLRMPQLAIKRAIDLVLTTIGLIAVAPVLLLIAIAIKLDSPGPIFFSQIRAGIGGRPFRMYKFRTMVADADAMKARLQHLNESGDPRLFKIRNDPRVTRVGRFLRRTSLDELPQLFNVLKGDMSLVGPRPFFPGDLDGYEDHHFERLHVLPGITGLWQVSGRSDVVDFEEVVRLDAEYIRGWSIWRDFLIMTRTIPAAFGRDGAY